MNCKNEVNEVENNNFLFHPELKIIIFLNEENKYQIYKILILEKSSYNNIYFIQGTHIFEENFENIDICLHYVKNNTFVYKNLEDILICRINRYSDEYSHIKKENELHQIFYQKTKLSPQILKFWNDEKNKISCIVMKKYLTFYEYFIKINSKIKLDYEITLQNFIIKIILKIDDILQKLRIYDFRHGDLKYNNILCEKYDDNIENINFLFIDFGFSSFKISEQIHETELFKNYIGKNNDLDDISFFILTLLKNKKLKIPEKIISNILNLLYIDKWKLIEIKDWNFYHNDINKLDLYNEKIAHKIKFSLKKNYREILLRLLR